MTLYDLFYYTLIGLVAFWLGGMTYQTVQLIRFARSKSRKPDIPQFKGRRKW